MGAEGFGDGFVGSALTGFGRAVVEDAEQVAAALVGSEGEPAGAGAGIGAERGFEDGWGFAFALHREQKAFGHLSCALCAGF